VPHGGDSSPSPKGGPGGGTGCPLAAVAVESMLVSMGLKAVDVVSSHGPLGPLAGQNVVVVGRLLHVVMLWGVVVVVCMLDAALL
jgi:hypothetical protein